MNRSGEEPLPGVAEAVEHEDHPQQSTSIQAEGNLQVDFGEPRFYKMEKSPTIAAGARSSFMYLWTPWLREIGAGLINC